MYKENISSPKKHFADNCAVNYTKKNMIWAFSGNRFVKSSGIALPFILMSAFNCVFSYFLILVHLFECDQAQWRNVGLLNIQPKSKYSHSPGRLSLVRSNL